MIPRKKDDQKERHGNRKIRDIKNEGKKKRYKQEESGRYY